MNPEVTETPPAPIDTGFSTRARRSASLALTLALGLVVTGPVVALSTDADQPIEIEADFAELDESEGRTVYRGNVKVRQGSLRMAGDVLRARFDEDNTLQEIRLTGRPARFRQTPDDSPHDIEGEALTIDYRQTESLLKLIENARLNKGGQRFEGNVIDYDTERSVIRARAARPSNVGDEADGDSDAGGRVRIVNPPKKKEPAP